MNYLSHLELASWIQQDPGFLLGAMLPDFASIAGGHLCEAEGPLAAGVAHHQAVDVVFHSLPLFRQTNRSASLDLTARGLPAPVSRVVAHVGFELLLDSTLLEEGASTRERLFRSALAAAAPDRLGATIPWRHEEEPPSFAKIVRHLLERGLPRRYRDPAFIAHCITMVLARRPRLAGAASESIVAAWALDHLPVVTDLAPRIYSTLREMLVPAASVGVDDVQGAQLVAPE